MHSNHATRLFCVSIFSLFTAFTNAEEAPEKALKYYEALLKRPHNSALFDRFYGAWIDEQAIEKLEAFLKARAQTEGGPHWTVLANYQLRRGNEAEALEALASGIKAMPEDPALPMGRAKLMLRRLEFAAARADLAIVTAGKDEVLALEASKLLGKSWLREGKTDEAIKVWDAVLAANPGDEDLLEDLVETAAAEAEFPQALVYIDRLIEVSRDPYQKTLRMLRRGDLLAQSGRNDEAVEAYGKTFNQVGEGSWLEREVLAQIEKAFRTQDRVDDLAAHLKKLAETFPQRLLIQKQLAKIEAGQGEIDSAIGRFREVLKRSPGERELREEFIRMLSDGERFEDAVTELGKLIELAPTDPSLHLQVATLHFRQNKPDLVLASLQKAHELLGKDESNGVRIAGLMLQYNLLEAGENLLKTLTSAPDAPPPALEALAAHYGRTNRKDDAIALLKKAGAGGELDVLLRTTGSISALGDSNAAYETLIARLNALSSEPRYLASLSQTAMAAQKTVEAIPQVLKLVRLAKQPNELAESINLASRVINAADRLDEVRSSLLALPTRTAPETCLLASLLEDGGDVKGVSELLADATDSMVIHFHAALLDRRGEFIAAIDTLSRLAETEEGKKAAYFKDLSELQQRAGKLPEALATVERWKLGAPGDKTAWITSSRLLRESGKAEEAVKMTRQAVSRFEGDTDLAASLASLYEESGQWQDSEAIYWKLYDEAQSPNDQARWAVQLAQLAQRTGKIDDMEQKLRERARSNRRSLGPILALAELARITEDGDKRRDLLLEAVRIQPKDIDLRLQIANLEEQSGNPDRVVAILEEALPFDNNGRIRSSLAQAYLRQGKTLKGLRELRLLAGKSGFDTRSAESAAASLAGTKLYDEAITLLSSELPSGGDWRSQYLLAVMLEEDGRETEAYPILLNLLQASGEIPALIKTTNHSGVFVNGGGFDPLSPEVRTLMNLSTANQFAYVHRNPNSGYSRYSSQNASQVGPFWLPNTPEDARQFAQIHLAALSKKQDGQVDENIRAQLKAAGMANVAFISDFTIATRNENRGAGTLKLFEAYPDEPGLFEYLMSQGMYGANELDDKLIKRALEKADKLSPMARFSAWAIIATRSKPEDPAWTEMLTASKLGFEDKNENTRQGILYPIMYLLQGYQFTCPDIHRPAFQEVLLAGYQRIMKDSPQSYFRNYELVILNLAGKPELWIDAINSEIREFRKDPTKAQAFHGNPRTALGRILKYGSQFSSRGTNPWVQMGNLFELPSLDTIPMLSIPPTVTQSFIQDPQQGNSLKPLLSPLELIKRLDQFKSPVLRAWLAAKSADKEAIKTTLNAVAEPLEEYDFELLRAVLAIQEKKFAAAFDSLSNARSSAGSDREIVGWLNLSLISLFENLNSEERAKVAEQVQATFLQSRQIFGLQGAPTLAAQARKLGLEELAKRIEPAAPVAAKTGSAATAPATLAAKAAASRRSSSGSTSGTPEKVRKFVAEKKFEAAAREVLLGLRNQSGHQSSYYFRRELPDLLKTLGNEGQAELLKLVEPTDSKSLIKRLEYVDVCMTLGKSDLALKELEILSKERPSDIGIASRLVFALPSDQIDRQIELFKLASKSNEFIEQVIVVASRLEESEKNKETFQFFDVVVRWLEEIEPTQSESINLTWVSYYAKEYFEGDMTSDLPSLIDQDRENSKAEPDFEKYKALATRLAKAMMRHANCAEEGFRLLHGAKRLKLEPKEFDGFARASLLAACILKPKNNYSDDDCFTLRTASSGSSSGSDLEEFSASAYLGKRMRESSDVAEILSPEFTQAVTKSNPDAGSLVTALTREVNSLDLKTLWSSELLKPEQGRLGQSLRTLILSRISSKPGATQFFIDQINSIDSGKAAMVNGNPSRANPDIFVAALQCAAAGKPSELGLAAAAISRAIFGEKIEFNEQNSRNNRSYYQVNLLETVMDTISDNLPVSVRAHSAFYHLGAPVNSSTYSVYQPFDDRSFKTPEEAIAFFESLGWLTDVDEWQPFACVTYDSGNSSNGIAITTTPNFILQEALNRIDLNEDMQKNIIKLLKERKTGHFGSLIIAGFLSSGKDRTTLIDQAFLDSKNVLTKLAPKRIDELSLIMPLISQDMRNKLPESFRSKLTAIDAKNSEESIKIADEFIANLKKAGTNDSFDEAQPIINRLLTANLDKAVEVFCAVEQAYTDSLARGGRYSNSSSNEWQYSMRDYELEQLIRSDQNSGPFSANPILRLRFIHKILATPTGQRLSCLDFNYSGQSIFSRLMMPLVAGSNKNAKDTQEILTVVQSFQSISAELRPTAFPGCLLLNMNPPYKLNAKQRQEFLPKLVKATENDPLAARIGTMRLAIWSWNACTAEEKSEIRKVYAEILADESLTEMARVLIARGFLRIISPKELLDESVSKSLGNLYQKFCAADRTAVSEASESLFRPLIASPLRDDVSISLYKSLATSFWENTSSPKAAGHPPIPSSVAQAAFILTLAGNDKEQTAKIFPRIKASQIGKFVTMVKLAQLGQPDLAKQLAPLPAEPFIVESNPITYTRSLEDSLVGLKQAGLDDLTLLKLEAELLKYPIGKDEESPGETMEARLDRLIPRFIAAPPSGKAFPLTLYPLFLLRSPNAELMPLLDAWVKKNPLRDFLGREYNSNGNPADGHFRAAYALHAASVMHAFAQGDSGALKLIEQAAATPTSNSNNTEYQLNKDLQEIFRELARRVWIDVCLDNTAKYKEGLVAWNDMIVKASEEMDYDSDAMDAPLAISHLIAYWVGEPAAFDKMCERLTGNAAQQSKKFSRKYGFVSFKYLVLGQPLTKDLPENVGRRTFIEKALCQPGLAATFPKSADWIGGLAYHDCADILADMIENPPAKLPQEVIAPMALQRARSISKDNPEEALRLYRKALEVSEKFPGFESMRGNLKIDLSVLLAEQKQPDEAKTVFTSITPDEVSSQLNPRYIERAKKLGVTPVISPLSDQKNQESKPKP